MVAKINLAERLNDEFSAAQHRWDVLRAQCLEAYRSRRQRLEQFEQKVEELRRIWESRLDALAAKFGKCMEVSPSIEPGKRSVAIEFQSHLARIKLRFTASPDEAVRNLVVSYDLEILPILMEFDSHDELTFSLDAINADQLAAWLDNRILAFVHTYFELHENPYYLRDHLVEDPVAKVQFPRFGAAAKLETNGKVHYFIDESTLREFEQRNNAPDAGP